MDALAFTLHTADGKERLIEFPLHPETADPESVGEMLEALLDALSRCVTAEHSVSNGDVLQALAMVTSIRLGMLPVSMESGRALFDSLLDRAADAEQEWRSRPTGRS